MNEFPKVLLSPHKVVYIEKKPGEKLLVFYTDLKKELIKLDQASYLIIKLAVGLKCRIS
jgi:hypothetical protein